MRLDWLALEMISLRTGIHSTVTPTIVHAKSFLVVLLTEQATSRFTRSTSMKYPYWRTWWIPLKVCFLICQLTWCGCCANKKKVMGFRGGTKTLVLVVASPRLLLSMLEVNRHRMKIHLYLLAMILRRKSGKKWNRMQTVHSRTPRMNCMLNLWLSM